MRQRGPLIVLAVALAILLPLAWRIARPFLTPFLLAGVLGIMMHPLRSWIGRKIRRPGLTALLTTLATMLTLMIPLVLVGFALTRELTDAYDRLNRMSVEQGGWQALVTRSTDRVLDAVAQRLPVNKEAIKAEALARVKTLTGSMLQMAAAAFGGVTSAILTGLLVMILLYVVLRHGEAWLSWLAELLPLDSRTTAGILGTVHDSIVANVNGVLAVAAAQGLLLGLAFWFVGIQSPVTWGIVGALASMIPVVGVGIVWLPFVIGLVVMGAYLKAAILGAWCVLVLSSIDNLIRALVVRGRVKQHPVLIALSIVGGVQAFGPLGLLLGPVVISLLMALVTEIRTLLALEAGGSPQAL